MTNTKTVAGTSHLASQLPQPASAISSTSSGATHTQWCSQDTGESSSPVNADTSSACTGRSRLWKRRTSSAAGMASSAPIRNATCCDHGASSESLRTMPPSDWFHMPSVGPIRLGSLIVCVQYRTVSCHAMASMKPCSARKVPNARAASARRPVSSRWPTKISGVSLTAAAMPISTPEKCRALPLAEPSTSTSTRASAIRITLIWP